MTFEEDLCVCGHERQDHTFDSGCNLCDCGEFELDREAASDDYEWEAQQ